MVIENGVLVQVLEEDIIDGKIEIPEGVTRIGSSAFSFCKNLRQIKIPKGITEIGNGAFAGCSSLTLIEIPEGVTKIGNEVFEGCSSLMFVKIPEGVTSIGDGLFEDCKNLLEVELPKGITEISYSAFYKCSSLTKIDIPEGVTSIDEYAFEGCSSLTDIKLPETLISIGNYAFNVCSDLTKIDLPKSITSIGKRAFYNCTKLTSIDIPEGVTSIGEGAFLDCTSLINITIPEGVTNIGTKTFAGCSSLRNVEIPKGVTSIGEDAFSRCSNLLSIKIPEGVISIGKGAFNQCSSLTSIEIPKGVISIDASAFYKCSNLTSVKIPEGVTNIGDNAFYECSSLISVTIPKGVNSIGEGAFLDCTSLTNITMPEGVTSIEKRAFLNCTNLTDVKLQKGLISIGSSAFASCTNLTNINIPETVKSIKSDAFYRCHSLKEVTIPEGVTSIEAEAFYECTNLEKVEILSDDLIVTLNAFGDCRKLKEPKLPNYREKGSIKFQKGGYVTIYEDILGKVQIESHTYSIEELIEKGKIDSNLSREQQEKIYKEYQKELEVTTRIYKNMPFEHSPNFNINTAIEYVEKMRKILGDEEIESLFRLPQEIDVGYTSNNILSVYEKRYSMKGNIPITVDILEDISGVVGKSERMKLFIAINGLLENVDENISFEELMKECATRAGIEVNGEVIGKIKGRVLQKEYTRKEEEIQEVIEKEVRQSNIEHRGIVSGIIANVIKVNELREGSLEDIEEILRLELGKKKEDGSEYYGRGITNEQMQEQIREIINNIYNGNGELVGKRIVEKLSDTKEQIGEKWIGKILQATSKKELDNMTSEEYEEMLTKLREKGVDTVKIEETVGQGRLVLRPGISKEEAIKVLVQEENPQVLTYEKAEMLFNGMKEPYSEKFRTWFKENREEIMERPEIYTILAQVHNRFDNVILKEAVTRTRFEQGLLDVSTVIDIYEDTLDKLRYKEGNEELAYKAQLVQMSQENYDIAEEIFETTKKRERSYIPTVESESKHYRGRILRADDVMNILAGDATNCCQRIGEVGENTARHGAMENTGRIFVVEELDENGNPVKIVAQSWVWRNKDRMCFDNIEVPVSEQGVLRDGKSAEAISRQEEILEIYRQCGERAIAKDEKLFSRLLKEGKITEEQYEALVLKDVTVGTGYNDLGILERRGLETVEPQYMITPRISPNVAYNQSEHKGMPWIDSGVDDGSQLYLAKNEKHEREGISTHEIEEVALEEMYKNKREVMRLKGREVGTAVGIIKEIEGVVFREEQQMLGNVGTHKDIAGMYGMNKDRIEAFVSRQKDWYMIFEEREDAIYIADLGAINGVNSQGQGEKKTERLSQSVEVMESVYGLMLEAGEKGKSIMLNATDDTSYLNIQNMAEKGIIQIKRSRGRQWTGDSEIGMHDMEITVDTEKMKEELEKVSKYRKKLEDREDR